jgi:hypothetical protein
MVDLTKAAIRFSWAMSLFGIQQFVNIAIPPDLSRTAGAALYPVKEAIEAQLNDSDLLMAAYLLGDEAQRAVVDLVLNCLTLKTFTPTYLSNVRQEANLQWRETRRVFSSPENIRLGWDELVNNIEVFTLVKNVSKLLQIPPDAQDFDLGQLIEAAYALGQFPDLWAVEGLGHDYAMTFWGKGKPIRGILCDKRAKALPDKSLTMMHAGMGLAFAEQLMNTVTPYSTALEIQKVLGEFVTLVRDNSRKGYEGAVYESLGLVTRFWHSEMVGAIDRHMQSVEPEAVTYFWHGVGRALYFLPAYFVPGLSSAWGAAEREPPYELAFVNTIAGLTWATTLVDVRRPQIMGTILKYYGDVVSKTPAFTNGVMSALIMGTDVTPDDFYINHFLKHRPSDPHVAELWEKLVGGPARQAVYCVYPVLKKHERLGEVFHYQNLWELATGLESGLQNDRSKHFQPTEFALRQAAADESAQMPVKRTVAGQIWRN